MPSLSIKARATVRADFAPLRRSVRVWIHIEAGNPVRAYLMDEDGLRELRDGSDFRVLAGSDVAATSHTLSAFIPRNQPWCLLVSNDGPNDISAGWTSGR